MHVMRTEIVEQIDSIIVGGHKDLLYMFDKRILFPILKWEHHKNTNELLIGTLEEHVSIWDVRKLYQKSTINNNNNISVVDSYIGMSTFIKHI